MAPAKQGDGREHSRRMAGGLAGKDPGTGRSKTHEKPQNAARRDFCACHPALQFKTLWGTKGAGMGMEEGRAKIADVLADWDGLRLQNVDVIATEQRHQRQFIVLWPIKYFFWTGPNSDPLAT